MYWYYKVFFVAIVGLILYGIFSIVGVKIPSLPKLTSTEEPKDNPPQNPEVKQPAHQGSNGGQITTGPVKPSFLNKRLTSSQNAILLEAKHLYEKDQKLDEAYEKLMTLLENKSIVKFSKGWYDIADFISKINTSLLLSSAPSERKENHKIKSGDSLSTISRGKTTITGLQKGNDIPLDSQTIHPGQVLRYFPGDWTIEIVKSHYILMLLHKGRFFKYYKVGVGKENRTPEGNFLISGKVEDPIWYKNGNKIQPGDPQNVLGSRWMKIKPSEGTAVVGTGYGIHGTTQPDSIGTPASQGCIRMVNRQIEELYDIIPHTKVVVTIRK
jgi:LysM repeat protein